jgi:predicted MFS family arabinose efflux permease
MPSTTERCPPAVRADTAGLAARVFLPFALGYFLSYVFRTVNSVIAPDLVADTGLTAADLGLLTSAFFLAFALAQLPLGLLLDRFGPRRVEAALLLVAAVGCLLFAVGPDLVSLTIARAAIGLGVSGCMMASFKAFVQWFPTQRLALANACLLAFGATGAMAATTPVEWLLGFTDWRTLFIGLGLGCVAVALLLIGVAPAHPERPADKGLRAQLGGLATVFRDRYFWRLAPMTLVSQSSFLAMQGLWAGPWLRDVAGLDRVAVAAHLLGLGAAVVTGFLVLGTIADRLGRRGVPTGTVAMAAMACFAMVQLGLAVLPASASLPLWMLFGLFGTAGTLSYAALSQHFHGQLAGRANTALNVLVFVAAFLVQWGVGLLLAAGENSVTNAYDPRGYDRAFSALILAQAASLAWFVLTRRKGS